MTDPLAALDAQKSEELRALRPETGLAWGIADIDASGSAAEPAEVLDFLRGWSKARAAVPRGDIAPRDRALYELDDRVLAARIDAFAFEQDASLGVDPDRLGRALLDLVEHVARQDAPGFAESLSARLRRLSATLDGAFGAQQVDPFLRERAVRVAASASGVLEYLKPLTTTDLDDEWNALSASLAAYNGALQDLPTGAVASTLGREKTDALLALRGFDLACDDVKDVARDTIEQMRIEQVRISRRAFKKAPVTQVVQTIRSQAPFSLEEAVAWAQELASKTRAFIAERVYFDADFDARELRTGSGSLFDLGYPVLAFPPRGTGELNRGLVILNGRSDEELAHLSVADLEHIVSQMLDPGLARAAAFVMTAGPLRRGSITGHVSRLAPLIGDETAGGWTQFASQLMREAGFRESSAARFVLARSLEHQAVVAWYDIALSSGDLSVDEAAAGIERDTDLDAQSARKMALALYRTPTRAAGRLLGRVRLGQVRRGARIRWRHGYSDRRFHEMVLSAGPAPVSLLFGLFDLFSPFNADEGTVEVSGMATSDESAAQA